ncbi:MAG: hypothetical protein A4E65_01704 [Syntrophorhabdus sp. PtaU1.Bin153]|nr:MAG: hypothetical protein A4E65_01704 [Syntrophorhabdus sp. PtaU1.Bin153]
MTHNHIHQRLKVWYSVCLTLPGTRAFSADVGIRRASASGGDNISSGASQIPHKDSFVGDDHVSSARSGCLTLSLTRLHIDSRTRLCRSNSENRPKTPALAGRHITACHAQSAVPSVDSRVGPSRPRWSRVRNGHSLFRCSMVVWELEFYRTASRHPGTASLKMRHSGMTAHHGYSEGERPEGEMDMFEPFIKMASLPISVKQALPWSGMERDARRDVVPGCTNHASWSSRTYWAQADASPGMKRYKECD